jgi:hypothetical protein
LENPFLGGKERELGEEWRGERRKNNIRVNVCWCILILRCTSKRHTPAKFCWCAPENSYTCDETGVSSKCRPLSNKTNPIFDMVNDLPASHRASVLENKQTYR